MNKSLKITIIIILACCLMGVLLVSCEPTVDYDNTTPAIINPPYWIIGTWSDEHDTVEFQFTNDNVIETFFSIQRDYKEKSKSPYCTISCKTTTKNGNKTFILNRKFLSRKYINTFKYIDNTTIEYTSSSPEDSYSEILIKE